MGWQTQKHNWVMGAWFAAIIGACWGLEWLKTVPPFGDTRVLIIGLVSLLVAAIVLSGAWLCIWWWRQLDEASQEAHKVAWYWGGSIGLGVGGMIMGVLLMPLSEASLASVMLKVAQVLPIVSATQPMHMALVTGWMISAVPALIGYVVVWGLWWRKRG